MLKPDALIPIGKIIATHGIKGHMKLNSYSGNTESLRSIRSVILKFPDGQLRECQLKSFNANSGKFIISLKEFDDIDQLAPMIGCELCVQRSQLPALHEDEYYWTDLIGLTVETIDGTRLGVLKNIFETGSSDVYVVRGNEREYLIPAIGDVIKKIDLSDGIMVINPLDGLLDL